MHYKHVIVIEKQDCCTLQNLKSLASKIDNTVINTNADINLSQAAFNLRNETEQFQRQLIKQVLIKENGNWAATARRLSVDRTNVNRVAKRLVIIVIKNIS